MKHRNYFFSITTVLLLAILPLSIYSQTAQNPFIYGDLLPDAPELAARGDFAVGVQTMDLVHKNQVDILNYPKDSTATYDRPLKVEVWYPATMPSGSEELVTYEEVMGNNGSPDRPIIPFTFLGRATRNALPLQKEGPYPLIIVSHGYTGSRFLLTYLTENLASKGYVVVAIDHTESTFVDAAGFNSTLLNRSLDVLFVLNEITRLSQPEKSFLSGLANTDLTALIGYSTGRFCFIKTSYIF